MDNSTTHEIQKNKTSLAEKEREQVKELMRRGAIRRYFLGPDNIWSGEGFGTVMGGFFAAFFGGILLPKLFLYSSSSVALKYVCWLMTAGGIAIIVRGLYRMGKELRTERKPVPDKVHDEILEYDIEGLKNKSKRELKENIPRFAEEENIDDPEMVLIRGPRDYVENTNLPLLWKLGDDGKIRYSNFSVMALYFGKDHLYIYTSIFNMRNGTSKFQHTYECPYDEIRYASFEDRMIEVVNQQNKATKQNLQMMVINAGDGEKDVLAIPIRDYDIIKKLNGYIDISDAERAVNLIMDKASSYKKDKE